MCLRDRLEEVISSTSSKTMMRLCLSFGVLRTRFPLTIFFYIVMIFLYFNFQYNRSMIFPHQCGGVVKKTRLIYDFFHNTFIERVRERKNILMTYFLANVELQVTEMWNRIFYVLLSLCFPLLISYIHVLLLLFCLISTLPGEEFMML